MARDFTIEGLDCYDIELDDGMFAFYGKAYFKVTIERDTFNGDVGIAPGTYAYATLDYANDSSNTRRDRAFFVNLFGEALVSAAEESAAEQALEAAQ